MKQLGIRVFALSISIAVLAAIVAGLILAGSPAHERARRFDDQRISDLQQLRFSAIDLFYQEHGTLPTSLTETQSSARLLANTYTDPETNELYSYRIISDRTYELCTSFNHPSDEKNAYEDPFWKHGQGHTCFTIDAINKPDTALQPAPAR